MKLDKFLKILWLINGIGLLIILLIAAFVAISESDFLFGFGGDDVYFLENSSTEVSWNLTYHDPEPIYGTENYLLAVSAEQYDTDNGSSTYSEAFYGADRYHTCVNVIFLDKDLRPTKTLLDKKAFIKEFRFPSGNSYNESDTTAKNLVYLIAAHDTNEDGNIDYSDDSDLFISDLSGNNLQQITQDMVISNYTFIQQGQKLRIDYLKKDDVEGVRHFALYNIDEKKLEKLSTLDESLRSIETLYKP